ncbi:MAG TPA: TerC family protein [Micropepsaceae bacterium]|nr:TerC family protein [Micropepsaceae bacterium]
MDTLALLTDPNAWLSLVTLLLLEIVLGIDNVLFIAIVSGRLPENRQATARRIGLSIAVLLRVAMLTGVAWILSLTQPLITLFGTAFSWRDLVLGAGGLFLLAKGTQEIHAEVEGTHETGGAAGASFAAVVLQIAVLDLVFSIDSVITAVGMAEHLEIMIAAVVLAILVMIIASGPVSNFINRHPTVKMLGLSFLLLIGIALIADAVHFHIPRSYLYFAIAFSALVEVFNHLAARRRARKAKRRS